MSTGHLIEKKGIELLRQHLRDSGRSVADSDNKTFDLIVDGRYAEVKCKGKPYCQLDFIGLTKTQFQALEKGIEYQLFVVCNVNDPDNLQVREIPAQALLQLQPEVDPTYYWYKGQLDKLFDEREGA